MARSWGMERSGTQAAGGVDLNWGDQAVLAKIRPYNHGIVVEDLFCLPKRLDQIIYEGHRIFKT